MLRIIKQLLLKIVDNIDAGNSNISESEALNLMEKLKLYTDKTQTFSKYQACKYLHLSRATFDNLVNKGLLPKGIKVQGFKELHWIQKDLDDYVNRKNNTTSNIQLQD